MKKQQQLGMNPSTAANRLVKDTLWRLVVQAELNVCHRCSEPMTRETFSIEHKEAWLDSADPVALYFDQENISFSHLRCNIKDARRGKGYSEEEALVARRASNGRSWTAEKRREYYLRSGK